MKHSAEPGYKIYVTDYGILAFAKNMGRRLNSKYGQKLLDNIKNSATEVLKNASNRAIQQATEATSDLVGHNIAQVQRISWEYKEILCTNRWNISTTNRDTKREICISLTSAYYQRDDKKLLINFDYYNY